MALAGKKAATHLAARCWWRGCQCLKAKIVQYFRRTTMKFRPLHDRVVVKRIDAEEKTAGGIIIPDTAKEKPSQGEIIAVGPGGRDESGKLIPIDLKVGDTVLFGKWSGTEVKIDGQDLLIMKESDIMGVIEGGSAAKKKAA
jgi:chaperonin GroES